MFLIPTGTDRDDGRSPLVVPLLAAACVAVYIVTPPEGRDLAEFSRHLDFLYRWGVSYEEFAWWQPVTHQFLHGGLFHILTNLFFLAAFGILLEARLGHLGFLAFYLVGGAAAGLLQIGVSHMVHPDEATGPAIGASGSVSALMGAVFALYPRANIRGIAIPQFVRTQVSIQWMMAFAIAVDVARTIMDWTGGGSSGIATLAHLGGLAFGFGFGVALLALRLVPRDDFDSLYLMRQWWRRREMRAAMRDAGVGAADGPVAARVRADGESVETEAQRTLRNTIAAAHRERDYTLAAQLYLELLRSNPEATLPAAIQLDVANQLAQAGKNADAARAYARFLERFRAHPAADDVRVMLAAIQVRRLGDAAAARATLAGFGGRELDRERQALVDALRQECA